MPWEPPIGLLLLLSKFLHVSTPAGTYFQVKTLKPLSTLRLQQLISLMEEETFKNEEYIATEGQLGEKFFIVVLGDVSIS